jgi:hypothetical protein
MKGIFLNLELGFDDPEDRADSEDLIVRLLAINTRQNLNFLHKNPNTPALYNSGVVYTPPDQADGRPPLKKQDIKELIALLQRMGADTETALMVVRALKGMEIFLDLPALYRRGKGDCNELVPVRVAELWRAGIAASPYLIKGGSNERGGISYHAAVLWPDGSMEDPSLILGMGGPERAEERREEIRKNCERWANHMAAARHLIEAEGALPHEVNSLVDKMGLVPSDGVFRSPYGQTD